MQIRPIFHRLILIICLITGTAAPAKEKGASPVVKTVKPAPALYVVNTKFITTAKFQMDAEPKVVTDRELQFMMRELSHHKGVDLLTAPIMIVKANQRGKTDRTKEVVAVPHSAGQMKWTTGVEAECSVIPTNGKFHLQGVARVITITDRKAPSEKGQIVGTTTSEARINVLLLPGQTLITPVGDERSHVMALITVRPKE